MKGLKKGELGFNGRRFEASKLNGSKVMRRD